MRGLFLLPLCFACLPVDEPEPEGPQGIPALGAFAHTMDAVTLTEISSDGDGLDGPRDLDFNPERPGELWVVNRNDDSVTIYEQAGEDGQTAQHLKDPFAFHFMEEVSSISFGTDMKFGTCQESRNSYDHQEAENDFMGPTLWSADLDIFAKSNPDAVQEVGYDLGSHLDMLHESPLCMGIAWVEQNVYFTFDGLAGTISRYDFQDDHGPGFDDHSDGIIEHYADVDVEMVADVPSHLVYDHDSGLLYIADTGHGRVLVMNPDSETTDTALFAKEPGTTVTKRLGAEVLTLVDGAEHDIEAPSGLALHGGVLYVGDAANGRITAFDLDGNKLDWLDTGLERGALLGLRVDEDGRLWTVDFVDNRVLLIQAP